MVNGFLTICAGVVLLQLSKSAKDVPDTAVFKGDLDQIQTIAEQEEPETEPKADAIRGTAGIVRRISRARRRWEIREFERLREEKAKEQLEPVGEDGPTYEWDGLRRRRTISARAPTATTAGTTSPVSSRFPPSFTEPPRTPHPPLGMSAFPTPQMLAEWERERDMPRTPTLLSSIAGTIRGRGRYAATSSQPGFPSEGKLGSPMHPVPLTEIAVLARNAGDAGYRGDGEDEHGLPSAQDTEYRGADEMLAPRTADSSSPRRQFSFHNLFRRQPTTPAPDEEQPRPRTGRHSLAGGRRRGYSNLQAKSASEEERIGLVKEDSRGSIQEFPRYEEVEVEADVSGPPPAASPPASRYGRGITTPPRKGSDGREAEVAEFDARGRRRTASQSQGGSPPGTYPLPPLPDGRARPSGGKDGTFI